MSSQNFEQLMNMYSSIKIGCAIAAVIFLLIAIALFFVLNIPAVFNELTGRGAKKAIEEMTAANESGGLSASRKIGEDGRRHKRRSGLGGTTKMRKNTSRLTGKLPNHNDSISYGLQQEERIVHPTQQSEDEMYTQPMKQYDETSVMNAGYDETTVMNETYDETSVLDQNMDQTVMNNTDHVDMANLYSDFIIERSIVEIHTDEVI